jgi:hypothetical protein
MRKHCRMCGARDFTHRIIWVGGLRGHDLGTLAVHSPACAPIAAVPSLTTSVFHSTTLQIAVLGR